MTFILIEDNIKNNWLIFSERGFQVAGPKECKHKQDAIDWAQNFISTWTGSKLVVK